MRQNLTVGLFLLIAFCSGISRVSAIDPRLEWISPQQLQKSIRATPLASTQQHIYLLSRASSSSLDWMSYKEYTAIWQKNKEAAYPNLYRGPASLNFYNSQYSPWKNPTLSNIKLAEIRRNAGNSLLRASIRLPESSAAQLAYGHFAWQYGGNMKRGLQIVEGVKQRTPKLPSVHSTLGWIYGNKSGNAYNLVEAESELLEAVRLDPKYAAPRARLVFFYLEDAERDVGKAQQHYKIWLSLLPPHLRKAPDVLRLQKIMHMALAKTKR